MENPILLILHFLETLIMIYMGGVLFNFSSRNPISFIFISIVNALIIYIIRSLFIVYKLPLGIHTIILFFIYVLLLNIYFKTGWKISLVSGLFGYILVIASEIVLLPIYIKIFNLSPEEIIKNSFLHLLLGTLDLIPLGIITILALWKERLQNLFNAINN